MPESPLNINTHSHIDNNILSQAWDDDDITVAVLAVETYCPGR